jgi:hypothetical protein
MTHNTDIARKNIAFKIKKQALERLLATYGWHIMGLKPRTHTEAVH